MQKKLRVSTAATAGIVVLLLAIVAIRIFEGCFYDPFIEFFKHQQPQLPHYETGKLLLGYCLRYTLTTALSLGIIGLVFKDRQILRLCALLYAAFFVVLIIILYFILSADAPNRMALFYVRRFLMQPLFLLLFVPAFYYQKYMAK
jgi:exosortase F-associated protein